MVEGGPRPRSPFGGPFDKLRTGSGQCRGGRVSNQLFQLIAILATAKLPEDRLSRAVFVLIRVAQTQSCWQMARSMRASVPFEGDHYGRTWANQLRNAPFRRISWSRWFQTRPYGVERLVCGCSGGDAAPGPHSAGPSTSSGQASSGTPQDDGCCLAVRLIATTMGTAAMTTAAAARNGRPARSTSSSDSRPLPDAPTTTPSE